MNDKPTYEELANRLNALEEIGLTLQHLGKELDESKNRYQRILAAVTNYVFSVRVENSHPVQTIHNVHCEAVTGYTLNDFNADPYLWINMVPVDDRHIVNNQAACILSADKPESIEHRITKKDGTIRWVSNTPVLHHDLNGNLTSYDGLILDITERKEAEEKLIYADKEWNNTFNTISDFVSVHDRNMRFVKVNKSLAQLLGTPESELIGKHCFEYMHGTDVCWPECPHVKTIEARKTVTEEVNDPHIGIPLLVTCSPFFDANGEIVGTVHIARDISQQKKYNEEKERLINELQTAISEIKTLRGIIPICAYCKQIRDDEGAWDIMEAYITEHTEAQFSHGICPRCHEKLMKEFEKTD